MHSRPSRKTRILMSSTATLRLVDDVTANPDLSEKTDVIAALKNNVIAAAALDVFKQEPLPAEYPLCRPDLTVFTYFHFAADEPRTSPPEAWPTTSMPSCRSRIERLVPKVPSASASASASASTSDRRR